MIKKKVKKIIGAALTLALASNSITYTAAVNTTGEKTPINVQAVEGDYLRKPTSSSEEDFKISKEIDTASEEIISVIVEFVSEPTVLSAKEAKAFSLSKVKVDRDHRMFEKFLAKMPSTYSTEAVEVKNSYTNVFNGVALNIKASEIESLFESGVVKRVHKDAEVVVEQPVEVQTRANEVETNQIEPFMMDSVPYLGVDELHKEDIKGQGVKVGVLDTGIDYNHPDLTNAYVGFRSGDGDSKTQDINTVKGWDFVDNDADPMETTYQDWKVSGKPETTSQGSYYTSHGTHVSGTIAGQKENSESEMPVLGVAPEVELYGYRVLGPYGSGATSGIIGAIEKSITDGMDVINMSLGTSANNSPYDPMTIAVNNATLAGVVTVISNGNSGPNNFTVGNPGTSPLPIAVGASTVDFNYDTYDVKLGDLTISGEIMAKDLQSLINQYEGQELEVVYCGLGKESDFEGKDLTGKIAYVERGDIALVDKVANAKKYGAAFAIMSNNVDSGRMAYLGELDVANTIAISKADGSKLKENLDKKIAITSTGSILVEGDEVTSFSSVGPVKQTFDIRPDVVAPGAQVFSTVPEFINDKNEDVDNYGIAYQRMSGTSMAAPHVSGIAALILQANPEYTPEQVKAALMNTSEHIHQKSGESYSVHEAGAGRVNPVNAVKEKVSFKANYKVLAGDVGMTYDNVTGMLSYGKLNMPEEEGVGTKTIPVTVENNTTESKTYNVEVEYSDSKRAKDAAKNGVSLTLPETVTVAPGEIATFDVTITAPVGAEFGTYEGYVHFNEVGNDKNDYQMPFSTTIRKNGFDLLDYPDFNGFAKGISAFTSSNLMNRHPELFLAYSDINVIASINDSVKNIYYFIKDAETGEYIGHAGTEEGWWIPEGVTVILENIAPNGRVSKIVDGKITHEKIALEEGLYDLELIVEKTDGGTFADSIPIGITNNTNGDEISYNFEPGITEVTEDMFTEELWYDGAMHEGLWIKANVHNETVEKMKDKGLKFLKQNEVNTIFAKGCYENGDRVGMGTMPEQEETIKVAGVEKSDLKDGFFKVQLSLANAGKVSQKNDNFIFVKEGTQYLSLDIENERISTDSPLKTTVSLNNVQDIVEGKFELEISGDAKLKANAINPTKELEEILANNNNDVEVSINRKEGVEFSDKFEITFKLTGDDVKGLNGDIKLFDVEYSVEELRGMPEKLKDSYQYTSNVIEGTVGEFKNSEDEVVGVKVKTIINEIDINSDRTLIYGSIDNLIRGFKGSVVYAVDPEGNRYEPTYMKYDEMLGYGYSFVFNNLPVIDGDYKVIAETPGSFNSIVNVPGYSINKSGERVGNAFSITGHSFLAPYGMETIIGDTNGDGAIDIVDAMELAKVYEAEIPKTKSNIKVDFNGDGKVDRREMDLLIHNYLKQDLTREDSKIPEAVSDGKDIIDVLESCGYFDETPEYNVELGIDKESSVVGETINLLATPPVQSVDFEYELSVREVGSNEWSVVSEKSMSNKFTWTSEKAGNYEFKLRIFKDDIEYVVQDNKTHTVKDIVISKPENLKSEATNNSVALTWGAPRTTDGLVGYVVYKDGKIVAEVPVEANEYTVEDLKANTIYGFKVTAKYLNEKESKPLSVNVRTQK